MAKLESGCRSREMRVGDITGTKDLEEGNIEEQITTYVRDW